MRSPIGIPCSETACRHLDAGQGRCGLRPPVAPSDCVWIFSLSGCGIARSYVELTGAADRLAARNLHLDDARGPDPTVLEIMAAGLGTGHDAAARAALRDRLAERARAADAARSRPSFARRVGGAPGVAGMLLLLALALLLIASFFREDREERTTAAPPRGLLAATPELGVDGRTPVAVEVRLDASRFVSIWFAAAGRPPLRLFPPLGLPFGLEWPLPPAGGRPIRLPAAPAALELPAGPGLLVVSAGEEGAPEIGGTLAVTGADADAIRAALPDSLVLEVGGPNR